MYLIIAITSLGKNRLSDLVDVSLNISTREKSFSKIAGFYFFGIYEYCFKYSLFMFVFFELSSKFRL